MLKAELAEVPGGYWGQVEVLPEKCSVGIPRIAVTAHELNNRTASCNALVEVSCHCWHAILWVSHRDVKGQLAAPAHFLWNSRDSKVTPTTDLNMMPSQKSFCCSTGTAVFSKTCHGFSKKIKKHSTGSACACTSSIVMLGVASTLGSTFGQKRELVMRMAGEVACWWNQFKAAFWLDNPTVASGSLSLWPHRRHLHCTSSALPSGPPATFCVQQKFCQLCM